MTRSGTKTSLITLAALSLGGLLLGGCGGAKDVNPPQYGVATLKTLSASPQRLVHDVRLDSTGSVSAIEQRSLHDFLVAIRAGYGDDISIEMAGHPASVRESIANVASRFGLKVSEGVAPTGAALPESAVRVVVGRSMVQLPACPDWSKAANPTFSNAAMSNFGCANRTNLGLMVADPADLERGRTYGGTDAKTITRGIEWRRDNKSKGFEGIAAATTTGSGGGSGGE